MTQRIHFTDSQGESFDIPISPGLTVAQAAYAEGGAPAPALCSGLGLCGRCRVRFLSKAPEPVEADLKLFNAAELAAGWRLGCRHQALDGQQVLLPETKPTSRFKMLNPSPSGPLCLALDLGTTSIVWQAMDDNGLAAQGGGLNPQMGAGSEVMSRLAYAQRPEGAARLRQLVLDYLKSTLDSLPGKTTEICLSGNPAMVYLLLGFPVAGLAAAPYKLDFSGGSLAELRDGLPAAYIPPLLGPFVGADLSAGLAHILWNSRPADFPCILADLGTNGEFVLLLSEDHWIAASVPLGPALEGSGLACGGLAEPGAATGFDLKPQGLAALVLQKDGSLAVGEPAAISGTGYLSLLHALRQTGAITVEGRFAESPATPLAARLLKDLETAAGERRLKLPGGLFLSASDLETLLKVKAACDMAFSRLLAEASLPSYKLKSLYLAGALGEHARPEDLEELGFLPHGWAARSQRAGNTSLAGAGLLLRRPELKPRLEALATQGRVLDLTETPDFSQDFISRMLFRHVS